MPDNAERIGTIWTHVRALAHRHRLQLIVLAVLFLGPLALAFWFYFGDAFRPASHVNHGALIVPARPLPRVSLATPGGTPTGPDFLRGRWSLVYVGAGACDQRCRDALRDTRAVRLALGRDMTRVQRVFLFDTTCCDRGWPGADHPDVILAWLDERDGKRLLAAFPADGVPVAAAGRIYLVDPLGNLLMSYPAGADATGMLRDLERLLRLSHIG